MNYTKIALIALFAGLGLFLIQISAGYTVLKKYEACAADWRAAHPGKLAPADMKALIESSVSCVEQRLNVVERLFFNAEAARERALQLNAKPAPSAAPKP